MRKFLDYFRFTIQGSTNLAFGGIKPSIKNIKADTDWEIPKNVRHAQSFLDSHIFIEDLLETIPLLLLLYIN
jgi:hypothetical protein